MLIAEQLIVENPRLVEIPADATYTTPRWLVEFDVRLRDGVGGVWLAIRFMRIGHGRLMAPRRFHRARACELAAWNGEFESAVLAAVHAAGWLDRWPSVEWPK